MGDYYATSEGSYFKVFKILNWSALNYRNTRNLGIIYISVILYTLQVTISISSTILLTSRDMFVPKSKPVLVPLDEQFHNHLSVQGKLLSIQMNQVLNPVHVQ